MKPQIAFCVASACDVIAGQPRRWWCCAENAPGSTARILLNLVLRWAHHKFIIICYKKWKSLAGSAVCCNYNQYLARRSLNLGSFFSFLPFTCLFAMIRTVFFRFCECELCDSIFIRRIGFAWSLLIAVLHTAVWCCSINQKKKKLIIFFVFFNLFMFDFDCLQYCFTSWSSLLVRGNNNINNVLGLRSAVREKDKKKKKF